jgi:hypothetical protein
MWINEELFVAPYITAIRVRVYNIKEDAPNVLLECVEDRKPASTYKREGYIFDPHTSRARNRLTTQLNIPCGFYMQ